MKIHELEELFLQAKALEAETRAKVDQLIDDYRNAILSPDRIDTDAMTVISSQARRRAIEIQIPHAEEEHKQAALVMNRAQIAYNQALARLTEARRILAAIEIGVYLEGYTNRDIENYKRVAEATIKELGGSKNGTKD